MKKIIIVWPLSLRLTLVLLSFLILSVKRIEAQNPIIVLDSLINVSCFGLSNGDIYISVSGGIPPYSYLWSTTATTQDLTNIPFGAYTVTVTDNASNTTTASYSISEPTQLNVFSGPSSVPCYGDSIGVLTATATGGTIPYSYLWSNSAVTPVITNLNAGTYTVTVTDANNCTATISATVTEPPQLNISISTTTNVSCYGYADGLLCATVTGGIGPYAYLWSNGATAQCIASLVAGTYSITVMDANSCTASTVVTITQPPALITIIDSIQNVSCFGGSNGAIYITNSGGTTPYSYLWSTSATVQDLINISAGTYTITVTDANNCTVFSAITLDCDSVWPGDANYDGIANNLDLLPIGIAYGNTGIVRPGATNNWVGQATSDWGITLTSGTDYKHIDCNGDGTINDADTIAISLNYGMTHPLRRLPTAFNLLDPYLYFDVIVDTAGTSQQIDVPLMFGTAAVPADSIYGLAFTVNYDTALVKADSVNISFTTSWIGTVGTDMITIQHNDTLNGQLHVGMTRTDHNNISGFGEIAKVTVVTVDNVSGRVMTPSVIDTLTFSFSNVLVIDKDENLRSVNLGSDTLIVEDSTTTIHEFLLSDKIKIYPNPVKDKLFLEIPYGYLINEILITNIIGEKMKIELAVKNGFAGIINLKNFSNGIYFIKIKTDKGSVTKKFSVIK
ncbi:MAG: T9SS type A sorting domain-containing protein [Bacteroidia bacterium]